MNCKLHARPWPFGPFVRGPFAASISVLALTLSPSILMSWSAVSEPGRSPEMLPVRAVVTKRWRVLHSKP